MVAQQADEVILDLDVFRFAGEIMLFEGVVIDIEELEYISTG